jgi:hypothetical protein
MADTRGARRGKGVADFTQRDTDEVVIGQHTDCVGAAAHE